MKIAKNFKFVQISGEDAVSVVQYDSQDNRIGVSTKVVEARVGPQGPEVKTESGSVYLVRKEDQHQSLWMIGLQAKRPGAYQRLVDAGVL